MRTCQNGDIHMQASHATRPRPPVCHDRAFPASVTLAQSGKLEVGNLPKSSRRYLGDLQVFDVHADGAVAGGEIRSQYEAASS
jgi:hypothetical protein